MRCKVTVDAMREIGTLDERCYGQFIEHLGECIYNGIWVGPDSKIPNERGFRKDVLQAVKELNRPLVRWPGGNFASGYHWQDGIGLLEQRPRRFDMAWGVEEPNHFGTDEFIEWCRLVGAEPFIVVNAGNGTPEEAARWVEYCNRAGDTYYASLRRKYGHEKPYGVRLWGIGNELYGEWQMGFCKDGAECARRTVEFANEMHRTDPGIELVAVGCEDPEWNIEMVKNAGKYFSYLSVHFYLFTEGKSYRDIVASPIDVENRIRSIYSLIQATRAKYGIKNSIRIAFDEWNLWYPEAKPPLLKQVTGIKDAIFTTGILNMLQRLCKIVPISNFAQTVNVLPLIIATSDGKLVLTPQYLVFKMYCNNKGSRVLKTFVDSNSYSSSVAEDVPYIDASATISEDQNMLYLYVLNRNENDSVELEVSFKGFTPRSSFQYFISGETVEDKNTVEYPDRIRIERTQVNGVGDKTSIELKPHSINVVEFIS
ncbi:MAG: alpha-N-arabinofuranosidase [Thermoproteota archaeon]